MRPLHLINCLLLLSPNVFHSDPTRKKMISVCCVPWLLAQSVVYACGRQYSRPMWLKVEFKLVTLKQICLWWAWILHARRELARCTMDSNRQFWERFRRRRCSLSFTNIRKNLWHKYFKLNMLTTQIWNEEEKRILNKNKICTFMI